MAYIMGSGNPWDLSQGWITKKDKAAAAQKQVANDPGIVGVGGVGAVGSFAGKAIPVAAGVGIGVLASSILGGGSKKDATQATSQGATQTTTPSISIAPYGINMPQTTTNRTLQLDYAYNPQIMINSPSGTIGSSVTSKKEATASPNLSATPSIYQPTNPSQTQTATPSLTQSDTGMGSLLTYLVIGVIAIGGIYVFSSVFKSKKKEDES